ncbi:hypothetical protein HHI36_004572 [Cryptolaemus montrouzieri]|uniref:Transmembrane protein 53 n=1 Tax=Cryptolaemus montrouzieri TaxID=559131 RepID=A0ABD2NT55_9CUCU
MENIEFSYNLTYPDPIGDYESQKEDSSFISQLDEDKIPIVILFGWVGAKDRYLSVYSRIYEAKGFITLRCMTSIKTMFLKKSHMPVIGEKLVKLLNDLDFGLRPIFVHCFSNGGSFLYQHFSQALKSSSQPLQIKGVIFDSAPSKRRLSTFFRALRPIVGGNKILNLAITLCLLLFVIVLWIWEYLMMTVFKKNLIQFKPLNNLIDEENKWPQHFIYSKTDLVVPYQDVEYFANHRLSLGVDVSMKCYSDTSHVKHYPDHKFTYTQSVFSFMSKCLDLSMV